MGRLTRNETAKPVSRDEVFRRGRRQGEKYLPCSAHHEQDWEPCPVDPYTLLKVTTVHAYIHNIHDNREKKKMVVRYGKMHVKLLELKEGARYS